MSIVSESQQVRTAPRVGRWTQLGRFRVRPVAAGTAWRNDDAPPSSQVFEFSRIDAYATITPDCCVAAVADEVACSCGASRADGPCIHITCLQCFGWLAGPSRLAPQPIRPAVQLCLWAAVRDEIIPW